MRDELDESQKTIEQRAKEVKLKLPKKLAEAADMFFAIREERYAADKVAAKLRVQEAILADYLVEKLPSDNATGIAGKLARVHVETKPIPTVDNWDAFYKYVLKNKAFDLLQRRLSDKAISERWEQGKVIPGVNRFNKPVLRCSKVKG